MKWLDLYNINCKPKVTSKPNLLSYDLIVIRNCLTFLNKGIGNLPIQSHLLILY